MLLSGGCTYGPCVVGFNSFERCWDCGCHGCQYDLDGAVMAGPATRPLEPFEPPEV